MTKWEYKTLGYNLQHTEFEEIDQNLTAEGSLGWESYAVNYNYPSISYFMKRQIEEKILFG